MDVFAGVSVTDLQQSIEFFDRLFGDVPTFDPNDTERVWTLTEHGHMYAVVAPNDAGHGRMTLFVEHLDEFLTAAAQRGVIPESEESYDNGVRKAIFLDPDGNEIGIGGSAVTDAGN